MKASDICVGDWVNYKSPSSGKLQPIKIENIYGCEFNCEVENWNIISGKSISDTEPIKLTEEILVKNGFVKTWNGDWQLKEYATIIISKDYYVKIFERSIRIDYVHELQHMLYAACVEKELVMIEL